MTDATNHFFHFLSIVLATASSLQTLSITIITFSLSPYSFHSSAYQPSTFPTSIFLPPNTRISPQNGQCLLPSHFHNPCTPYRLFSLHATFPPQVPIYYVVNIIYDPSLSFLCVVAVLFSHCLQVPVQDCDDDSCMTFVFTGETHTLGNALRYVVAKK